MKKSTNYLNLLKRIFFFLRLRKKNKFNRVLPISELISDRWEKANYLGFGTKSSIYDLSYVYGDVKVGKHTWVGPFTILDGSGVLSIGSYCNISAGVQIYTHDSVEWAVSGGKSKYKYSSTKIGDNCYIGPNTIISRGVTIGDGCIVGANSFVNKSFPSNTKLAGSPAKQINDEKL
jgi:acetyltransferase-like isoleucine patch superfamily enzyme